MPQKHSGSSQGQSSSNDNEEADGPAPPAPVLPHMAGVASRGPTEGEVGSSITFPGLLGPSIVPPPQSVTGPDGVPLFNEANPPPPAVTAPPVVPTEAPIVMNLGASADTGTTLPTTPDGLSALLQQSDPSGDENKKIDPKLVVAYFTYMVSNGMVKPPEPPKTKAASDEQKVAAEAPVASEVPKSTSEARSEIVDKDRAANEANSAPDNPRSSETAIAARGEAGAESAPRDAKAKAILQTLTPLDSALQDEKAKSILQALAPLDPAECPPCPEGMGGWEEVKVEHSVFGDAVVDGSCALAEAENLDEMHKSELDKLRERRRTGKGAASIVTGGCGGVLDPLGLSLEELENEPELNADDLQVQEKPIFEKKSSETAEGTAEGAPVKAVFAKRKTKVKAPNCRSAV
eukprot:Selendium_serpulae@DN5019_c0_g1_i2.p1